LRGADFREAQLGGVIFCQADLTGARFAAANLFTADLRGADLTGARELTSQQLLQARTDQNTILPNGSRGPYRRHSGAERPQVSDKSLF
jgi:hypothetical protein